MMTKDAFLGVPEQGICILMVAVGLELTVQWSEVLLHCSTRQHMLSELSHKQLL